MTDKITIDRETLKALAVDTRLNILKLLSEGNLTQADISVRLGLKAATVKEHLDHMQRAGLIEREVTDRKWKYFSLSDKGRGIIMPGEKRLFFAFLVGILLTVPCELILANTLYKAIFPPMLAGARHEATLLEKLSSLIATHSGLALLIIAIQALWFICAFLLGRYMKKQVLVIQAGEKNEE